MGSFLKTNLAILQKKQPGLASALNLYIKNNPHPLQPLTIPSKQASPEVLIKITNPAILVLLGLGNGHELIHFFKNPHPLCRFLIVYEPSIPHFLSFLDQQDLTLALTRLPLIWIVGQAPEDFDSLLENISQAPGFAEAIPLSHLVQLGDSHPYFDYFKKAWERLKSLTLQQIESLPIDAYYGFQNFIRNQPSFLSWPLIQEFKGCFHNIPGIVVSAGPSLEGMLDSLKKIQDKAVLFVVDSALKRVIPQGIQPDVTGVLERTPLTQAHFESISTKSIPLVTTPIIHPKTLAMHQGPTIFVPRSQHYTQWLLPWVQVDECGISSVSHLGLYTLAILGCRPIYLVGQDLAFDPQSGVSHYKGYGFEFTQNSLDQLGYEKKVVESNQGTPIVTYAEWARIGQLLERLVYKFSLECYQVIPKTHGIKLKGIPRLDPQDMMDRLDKMGSSVPIEPKLEKLFDDFSKNKKAFYQSEGIKNKESTQTWLKEILANSCKLSLQIQKKAATIKGPLSKEVFQKEWIPFLNQVETYTNTVKSHPLAQVLLNPLVLAKQVKILVRLNELMSESPLNPDILREQLGLACSWQAEIIVRSRLALGYLFEGISV